MTNFKQTVAIFFQSVWMSLMLAPLEIGEQGSYRAPPRAASHQGAVQFSI